MSTSRSQCRPAAVADVRLAALLDAADELAKRWLLALLESRPLRGAGELSLSRFARQAPALCARVLRALQSEPELDALRSPPHVEDPRETRDQAAALDELVGATQVAEIVEACEALRCVLWRALSEMLTGMDASVAGRVGDRLAHACSLLAAGAVASRSVGRVDATEELVGEENDRAPRIELQEETSSAEPDLEDPWAIDVPTPREESPWSSHVASEIERRFRDGEPFAVLLVELVSFDRLREAEDPGELEELVAAAERALLAPLGPSARLAAEGAGRWWLVAPELRAAEARALADRLARSVSAAVTYRGAPLRVAVGIAASPDDGREASELAERAEDELYAARAAGVGVLPARSTSAAPGPGEES